MPPFPEETDGGGEKPPTRKAGGGRHGSHLGKPNGGRDGSAEGERRRKKPPKILKLSIFRSKVQKLGTFGSLIFRRAGRTFDLWIQSSKLLGA